MNSYYFSHVVRFRRTLHEAGPVLNSDIHTHGRDEVKIMEKTKNSHRVKLPRIMILVRIRGFIDRLFGSYTIDKTAGKFTSPYITAVASVINTVIPQKREAYADRIYRLSEDVTGTCIDLDALGDMNDYGAKSSPQQKRAEDRRKSLVNILYKKYAALHRELSNSTIPEEEVIHELAARVNLIIAHYMRGFNLMNRRNRISTDNFPFLNELESERIHNEFVKIRNGEYVQKALEHVSRELADYEG